MVRSAITQKGFGSTPFDKAKEVVELVYMIFPQCPFCGSKGGYHFSGWFNDCAECRECKAKWEIESFTVRLVRPPAGKDYENIKEIIGKTLSVEDCKRFSMQQFRHIQTGGFNISESIRCSCCGHLNRSLNSFCENCGKSLEPRDVLCSKCRSLNTRQANFCGKCGAQLAEDQTRIY